MGQLIIGMIVAVVTFGLAATLVPLARRAAERFGIVDHPGTRKIHAAPMPRSGGIALFVSFTCVVLAGYLTAPHLPALAAAYPILGGPFRLLRMAPNVEGKLLAILTGAALVFLVGLVDDKLGTRFPVAAKAAGQITAAAIVIAAGIRITVFPYDWLNLLMTLIWIVGITNAFNLLDNMDGLSAGVAFVACLTLLINTWSRGEYFISLLLLAFMGSLLGFLLYNFHPAKIFLGDCGSLFIGFIMASLTLLTRYVTASSSSLFPTIMPVVILAIPIVDTFTVIFIRVREGRPVYVGDRRHLSHRLLALGFSQRTSALFLYLATFCLGLGVVTLSHANLMQSLLILLQAAVFITLLLILMFFDRRRASAGGDA